MFKLHDKLQDDTLEVVYLALSRVLLMNDSSFPWLILVPARKGIREIHELDIRDRSVEELNAVVGRIKKAFQQKEGLHGS